MSDLALESGQWTPTGWGAQHRVRAVDGDRVTLVCHSDRPGQYAELSRMRRDAGEVQRCRQCEVTPGLGPMPAPVLDEIRIDPATRMTVVCALTWDGRVPTSPVDPCWRIVRWGSVPAHATPRGSLDSYDVATWTVVGSLPTLAEAA